MYKVLVRRQIHGSFASLSSEDAYVIREVDLPFPPFVGLNIGWRSLDGEISEGADITEISFDADTGQITCYVEGDKEIYAAVLQKRGHRRIEDIVREHISEGWLLDPRHSHKRIVAEITASPFLDFARLEG